MTKRRDLLSCGICAAALLLLPSRKFFEALQRTEGSIVAEEKIKEIFARYVLFDEKNSIPAQWSAFPDAWKTRKDLRDLVYEELGFKSLYS